MGSIKSTKLPGLLSKTTDDGDWYYIDKRVDGKRVYHKIGYVSFNEAKKSYFDILAKPQVIEVRACSLKNEMRVSEALEFYWEHHAKLLKSGMSMRSQFTAIDLRLGEMAVTDLNKSVMDLYRFNRLKDTGLKSGNPITLRTVQAELKLLNAALNHAVDMTYIEDNPVRRFHHVKLPKPDVLLLDDGVDWGEEWAGIFENLCPSLIESFPDRYLRTRVLILCLYETGMRPDEVFSMHHNWIREVQPGFMMITVPKEMSKTKMARRIPVSDRLGGQLTKIWKRGQDGLLFPSPITGMKFSDSGIKKVFKAACERAGLDERQYTPYALRRTRTTIWDSIDEGAARFATGHTPQDSHRKHYVRMTDKRLFLLVGKNLEVQVSSKMLLVG